MSHKFNITIKLEDARYCEGCPCLSILFGETGVSADVYRCSRFNVRLKIDEVGIKYYLIRPAICIEAEKARENKQLEKTINDLPRKCKKCHCFHSADAMCPPGRVWSDEKGGE